MQMISEQTVFKRIEKKYMVTDWQYDRIIAAIRLHTNPDSHKSCTIFSLYFDTPDYLLIRRSIDKPVYKEKLRLRTYGVPQTDTPVFAEIKKKYKKVVYKRRAEMTYGEAIKFLTMGRIPKNCGDQQQIINEISWFLKLYPGLSPSILISYDRRAFYGTENPGLRITFDSNILWRSERLAPSDGVWGEPLLEEGLRIMEIKIPGAMPLWLADLLTQAEIFPTSFSKYGTAYTKKLLKGEIKYGS